MKKIIKITSAIILSALIFVNSGCKVNLDPVENPETGAPEKDIIPENVVTTGNFVFNVELTDETAKAYCNYADCSVLKNDVPVAGFDRAECKLNEDKITISTLENKPVEKGEYKIVIVFYPDSYKFCEFYRIEKTFEVKPEETVSENLTVSAENIVQGDSFAYGIWGEPEGNPGNVRFVVRDTNLFLFGNGEMYERSKSGDVYSKFGTSETEPAALKAVTKCLVGDGITTIGGGAFYEAPDVAEITGCKDINKIESNAFYNAHISVIPAFNSVTEIGEKAFYGTYIEVIDGFEAVTTIGKSAFRNCLQLKSIKGFNNFTTFNTDNYEDRPFYICDGSNYVSTNPPALEEVSGFNNVTSFPLVLAYCKNLKKISGFNKIGTSDTYKTIDINSFWYPINLGSYDSKVNLEIVEGFDNLKNLDIILIGDKGKFFPLGNRGNIKAFSGFAGFTEINASTFSSFSALETLSGFDNVTKIGDKAFQYCNNLKSLNGFAKVTEIGEFAFYHCEGLTELPEFESLTKIGKSAFSNCFGITKIEGFDKVTSVADFAFTECCNVTDIIGFNSLETASSKVFLCSSTKSSLKHVKGFNNLKVMVASLFNSYALETFEGFQNVETIYNWAVPCADYTNPNFIPSTFIYYGKEDDFAKIKWEDCSSYTNLYSVLTSDGCAKIKFDGKKDEWIIKDPESE